MLLMYIHIFLFVCGGLVSTGFVGAVGFDTVVVYGGFNIGIVVVVGSTWGYVLVWLIFVVCYGKFDSCCCCLFLMFYRMFIYLRIVFWIYLSVLLMVSGGVYLSI